MATSLADSMPVTESVRPGFQLQFSPQFTGNLGPHLLKSLFSHLENG